MNRYRVFVGTAYGDIGRQRWTSADFPSPETTHTWWGAMRIVWRYRHDFDRIAIERVTVAK